MITPETLPRILAAAKRVVETSMVGVELYCPMNRAIFGLALVLDEAGIELSADPADIGSRLLPVQVQEEMELVKEKKA